MVPLKKVLLLVLIIPSMINAMCCKKTHQKMDNEEKHIHIHTNQRVNKVGVGFGIAALLSTLVGIGFDSVGVANSAPASPLDIATPMNTSRESYPSYYEYQNYLTSGDCSDSTTIMCSPEEIDFYSYVCESHLAHDRASMELTKRLLRKRKGPSQHKPTTPCEQACHGAENQIECSELAIRDNGITIKKCTDSSTISRHHDGIQFNMNIFSLLSRLTTVFSLAGTVASHISCQRE